MDKWIRKPVEWSDDDCYITCPYCNGPTALVTKGTSLKYCPHCGARMDDTDASDAELVDMLQDVIKGKDETITSLKCQLEQAQEEIDKADGYYCSMIDNLRDDIQDLKQQLALSDAACGDVIRTKRKLEEELFTKHNEYAQLRHEYDLLNAVFEDMKRVVVKVRPNEWATLAKKHNKED